MNNNVEVYVQYITSMNVRNIGAIVIGYCCSKDVSIIFRYFLNRAIVFEILYCHILATSYYKFYFWFMDYRCIRIDM